MIDEPIKTELEQKIDYSFSDCGLLENALTHSSFANEKNKPYECNNERLEFLGDAVLELISSEYIFTSFDKKTEGKMTKLRASLVCEMSLADAARDISLGDYILLGKGEKKTGGRYRDSILSDAFEALIGAIYLDGGYDEAKKFVKSFVLSDIENRHLFYDSKTILQEIVQSKFHEKTDISYPILSEEGPAHEKVFKVQCMVNGKEYGEGEGSTKKKAEQKAAYEAIKILRG